MRFYPQALIAAETGLPIVTLRGQSGIVVPVGSSTPLNLRDIDGNVIPNTPAEPIYATLLGFTPLFDTVEDVMEAEFLSNGIRSPLRSDLGIRDQVYIARDAALDVQARIESGELKGEQGDQGLPGVNAVPASEAVAAYLADKTSAARQNLDAAYTGTNEAAYSAARHFTPAQLAGTADAAPAIQAAINAASTAGFSRVVLPSITKTARYRVGTTITVGPAFTLDGNGATLVIANGATLANGAIYAVGRAGVVIRDLTVLGPVDGTTGGAGIKLTDCTDGLIENVTVRNTRGHGIEVSNAALLVLRGVTVQGGANCLTVKVATGLVLESSSFSASHRNSNPSDANVYLEKVTNGRVANISSTAAAGHGIFIVGANSLKVSTSDFSNNGASSGYVGDGWFRGASIGGTLTTDQLSFVDCTFNGNRENGVLIPGVSQGMGLTDHGFVSFVGCVAKDNNKIGAIGGHGFEVNSRFSVIKGCVATGNNAGIWVQNSIESVIEGNLCRGNAGIEGRGIAVYSANGGVRVANNVCKENGKHGIYVHGDPTDAMPGISIIGNEAGLNGQYGIWISERAVSPLVALNYCHGNTTGQASITPTGPSVVVNNQGF